MCGGVLWVRGCPTAWEKTDVTRAARPDGRSRTLREPYRGPQHGSGGRVRPRRTHVLDIDNPADFMTKMVPREKMERSLDDATNLRNAVV